MANGQGQGKIMELRALVQSGKVTREMYTKLMQLQGPMAAAAAAAATTAAATATEGRTTAPEAAPRTVPAAPVSATAARAREVVLEQEVQHMRQQSARMQAQQEALLALRNREARVRNRRKHKRAQRQQQQATRRIRPFRHPPDQLTLTTIVRVARRCCPRAITSRIANHRTPPHRTPWPQVADLKVEAMQQKYAAVKVRSLHAHCALAAPHVPPSRSATLPCDHAACAPCSDCSDWSDCAMLRMLCALRAAPGHTGLAF